MVAEGDDAFGSKVGFEGIHQEICFEHEEVFLVHSLCYRIHTGKVVHLYEMLDAWRSATIVFYHRPHQTGEYQILIGHYLMSLNQLLILRKDNANERNESLLSNCRVQLILYKDKYKS